MELWYNGIRITKFGSVQIFCWWNGGTENQLLDVTGVYLKDVIIFFHLRVPLCHGMFRPCAMPC
jgi:wobble nucleotide-excising tRNase